MTGTFNETYFDFDEEVQRLEERIDDLRANLNEMDDDAPQRAETAAQLQQVESEKKGVIWARDRAYESEDFPQWDEDVDGVTLGGLRAGAYSGLQDDLSRDDDAGAGTTGTLLVAEGTVEAPYVDDSMTDVQRVGAVKQLHPFYRTWAEARVNALMDPEGNGRG